MADSVVNTLLLFLGVLSVVLAESDNETVASNDGVYVKVLGHSGKIMMSRSMDIETDERRIVVEFDEIKEKAENGADVGTSGNPSQKHVSIHLLVNSLNFLKFQMACLKIYQLNILILPPP